VAARRKRKPSSNRAGHNLSASQLSVLERAKNELRASFGKPMRRSAKTRRKTTPKKKRAGVRNA
jgi:hypothetical protein